MAIPAFQDLMLPLLIFASDGQEHTPRETVETLADEFSLAEADRQELLPSGRQATFDNRVAWAKAHMKMAGPLSSPKRGIYRITDRGQEVVKQAPQRIDLRFLRQFPEYIEARTKKKGADNLSDESRKRRAGLRKSQWKPHIDISTTILKVKYCRLLKAAHHVFLNSWLSI